jgi:hypothetical protein
MSGSVSSLLAMVTCNLPITSSCSASISKRWVWHGHFVVRLGRRGLDDGLCLGLLLHGGPISEQAASTSKAAARPQVEEFHVPIMALRGLLQQQRLIRQFTLPACWPGK